MSIHTDMALAETEREPTPAEATASTLERRLHTVKGATSLQRFFCGAGPRRLRIVNAMG